MPERWQTNWVDYYKILQVHLTAEPEVIKAAYDRLARKYHPDLNDSPAALERMKGLNEAYEILGNLEKRRKYHAEYLLKKSSAESAPAEGIIPPKPEVDPPFVQFKNVQAGKPYRRVFVIRNKGGKYSRLDIEHGSPWLRIIRQTPMSNSDRLPLEVEIEALGQDADQKYVDNVIIKLDEAETHIRVELQTTQYRRASPAPGRTEGPDPHFPCVLLIDTSEHAQESWLKELSSGLTGLNDSLGNDPVARKRAEIAVLTFDSSVLILQGLVSVSEFKIPDLTTGRDSLMGSGINKALDIIESRKLQYQSEHSGYYRPWVLMISAGGTRGEPEERIAEAAKRIAEAENKDSIAFFAVGANGADMELLRKISVRAPVRLADLNFSKLFSWLSLNISTICRSKPGEKISLQPIDWGVF